MNGNVEMGWSGDATLLDSTAYRSGASTLRIPRPNLVRLACFAIWGIYVAVTLLKGKAAAWR